MRILLVIAFALLAIPASAQQQTVGLQLSDAQLQLLIKGVRKLTIEEGGDLLNDIARQVMVQQQEAAKKAAQPPAAPAPDK